MLNFLKKEVEDDTEYELMTDDDDDSDAIFMLFGESDDE